MTRRTSRSGRSLLIVGTDSPRNRDTPGVAVGNGQPTCESSPIAAGTGAVDNDSQDGPFRDGRGTVALIG